MARKSFTDPDFSMTEISESRRAEARIREQVADHRRTQVQATDPRAAAKSPWKVSGRDTPSPPRWEAQRDPAGQVIFMKQLRRDPAGIDVDPRFTGRRYICEIIRPIMVGGEHLEPGARVDCFADGAFSIHSASGRIIEEFAEQ